MARFSRGRRIFIHGLCVVLVLVCTFCLLIPHLHECDGIQCQVCALFSLYEMLWLPAAVVAVLFFTAYLRNRSAHKSSECTVFSLVGQKVKLSD